MLYIFLGALFLFLVWPLILAVTRANEVFVLRVRSGTIVSVRGRLPQRLQHDLEDIVARPASGWGRLKVRSENGRGTVYFWGDFSEAQRQRARNVVGLWTVKQLRSAPYRKR